MTRDLPQRGGAPLVWGLVGEQSKYGEYCVLSTTGGKSHEHAWRAEQGCPPDLTLLLRSQGRPAFRGTSVQTKGPLEPGHGGYMVGKGGQ